MLTRSPKETLVLGPSMLETGATRTWEVSAGKMVEDSSCWRVNFMDSLVSELTFTLDGLIDGLID